MRGGNWYGFRHKMNFHMLNIWIFRLIWTISSAILGLFLFLFIHTHTLIITQFVVRFAAAFFFSSRKRLNGVSRIRCFYQRHFWNLTEFPFSLGEYDACMHTCLLSFNVCIESHTRYQNGMCMTLAQLCASVSLNLFSIDLWVCVYFAFCFDFVFAIAKKNNKRNQKTKVKYMNFDDIYKQNEKNQNYRK